VFSMENNKANNAVIAPQQSIPNGGGTIRGADENFHADAFTGTATFTISIPLPAARSLTPSFGIGYGSNSGNGLLGMGFHLSESSISIKTNRALPKYDGSDSYLLNESTELVQQHNSSSIYIERHQSSFALIEKIEENNHVYWRVTNNDNSRIIFGNSDTSQVADLNDPKRIYKWLISEETDATGNKIKYHYARLDENDSNTYLTSIEYGNYFLNGEEHFAFNVLIDYGQMSFTESENSIQFAKELIVANQRQDRILNYRAGFLVSTQYLVKNVFIQHHFIDDPKTGKDCFTHRTAFQYNGLTPENNQTTLKRVVQYGLVKSIEVGNSTSYKTKSLPPIDLTFSQFSTCSNIQFTPLKDSMGHLINQPLNLVDLYREGINGNLYRNAETLYYSCSLGNGEFEKTTNNLTAPSGFSNPTMPINLVSLEGNGNLQLEWSNHQSSGYYPLLENDEWGGFVPFEKEFNNNIPEKTSYVNLSGSNFTDHLTITPSTLYYRQSLGLDGMSEVIDEIENTTQVEPDGTNTTDPYVYFGFADLFGDGLSHRIKLENEKLTIWPCLGYGKFAMAKTIAIPEFNIEKQQIDLRKRLLLADVNGSGNTDIVLIYSNKIQIFYNYGGNGFSNPVDFTFGELTYSDYDHLQFIDVVGNGNTCLVFSKLSPHAYKGNQYDIAHYYYEFEGKDQKGKSFLLTDIDSNMGATKTMVYKSSIKDYLRDKNEGNPWITHLPFPIMVLDQITQYDFISNTKYTSSYNYRNGFYDPDEHAFVGFGYVEHIDLTKTEDDALAPPPTLSKQWFHAGIGTDEAKIKSEFFQGDKAALTLPFHIFGSDTENNHEALYALAGSELRSEIYEYSPNGLDCPYVASDSSYEVLLVQKPENGKRAVYRTFEREGLIHNYEKRANDPHVSHHLVLEIDAFNQPLKACQLVYPRRATIILEQSHFYATASTQQVKNQTVADLPRYVGVGIESKSFEITGLSHLSKKGTYFSYDELAPALVTALDEEKVLHYSATIPEDEIIARLLAWGKVFYWKDEQQDEEWNPESNIPPLLLPKYSQSIVFDAQNATDILNDKLTTTDFSEAGYFQEEDYWWSKTAVASYKKTQEGFFLPEQSSYDWVDKSSYLYTESKCKYDAYHFFAVSTAVRFNDELFLTASSEIDYRVLQPHKTTDVNGNSAEVLFDELGMVVVSSVYGKSESCAAGDAPLSEYSVPTVNSIEDVFANPFDYIQKAASFFYYEFAKKVNNQWEPACVLSLSRTVYQSSNPKDIQRSIAYNDGFGRTIEAKAFTGKSNKKGQWLASGRVTYNAKGEVAQSYLGYFSDTWKHETSWDEKVKNTLPHPTSYFYDALDRNYQVNTPKGFLSRTLILNAWETQHYDESDTVLESDYYLSYVSNPKSLRMEEIDALEKSIVFYNTPATIIIDALGRNIIAVSSNQLNNAGDKAQPIDWTRIQLSKEDIDPSNPNLLVSWQSFDIQGRTLLQADPRFHAFNQSCPDSHKKYNFKYRYPIAAGMATGWSSDAGNAVSFNDTHGNTRYSWDALQIKHSSTYDNLQRPLSQYVETPEGSTPSVNQVTSLVVYGEQCPEAKVKNMLGKAWKNYDTAGLVQVESYTFDGHPVKPSVNYRIDYKEESNWSVENIKNAGSLLEEERFCTQTEFDALGRPIKQTQPDESITTWSYGEMGNCIRSTIQVKGQEVQTIVKNSGLDANGQLTRVEYANGAITTQKYDPLTLGIQQLKTQSKFQILQDLKYWHDPTGLITTQDNQLAKTVYANNQQINPTTRYTYDALYRLKEADGRQLQEKSNVSLSKKMTTKLQHVKLKTSSNLQQLENYIEKYVYDKSNNLLQLQHICSNGYTRNFTIDEHSNRVLGYTQGVNEHTINYNAAGYMCNTNGTGTAALQWNVYGNIANAIVIEREDGTHDAEYYVYSAGLRVRKVTERFSKDRTKLESVDKRYLGEYRRTQKDTEMRHSITIGGVQKHDCLVQYSTEETTVLYRYQHANHLNSVGLETNGTGDIITYEEYSPYGETVYTLQNEYNNTKEYRYSAQEKDESTGLYYYGYRYYAPSLCRWTRPDPAGTIDGFNLYAFVGNEPIGKVDVMGLMQIKSKRSQLSNSRNHKNKRSQLSTKKRGRPSKVKNKQFGGLEMRVRANADPNYSDTKSANDKQITQLKANKEYKNLTQRIHWKGERNSSTKETFGISPKITKRKKDNWDIIHISKRNELGKHLTKNLHYTGFKAHAAENSHLVAGSNYGPNDILSAPAASVHQNTEMLAIENAVKDLIKKGVNPIIKVTGYVHSEGNLKGTLKASRYKIYIGGKKKFDHLLDGSRSNIDLTEATYLENSVKGLTASSQDTNLHNKSKELSGNAVTVNKHGTSTTNKMFTDLLVENTYFTGQNAMKKHSELFN